MDPITLSKIDSAQKALEGRIAALETGAVAMASDVTMLKEMASISPNLYLPYLYAGKKEYNSGNSYVSLTNENSPLVFCDIQGEGMLTQLTTRGYGQSSGTNNATMRVEVIIDGITVLKYRVKSYYTGNKYYGLTIVLPQEKYYTTESTKNAVSELVDDRLVVSKWGDTPASIAGGYHVMDKILRFSKSLKVVLSVAENPDSVKIIGDASAYWVC